MTYRADNWLKIKSSVVYKNKWLTVREDQIIRPDGSDGIYSVVTRPSDAVFVIPVVDDAHVLLIHQYRYPIEAFSWEIPAGATDGEDIFIAAKRELQEETSYITDELTLAGSFYALNGLTPCQASVLIARNIRKTNSHLMEVDGIDEVKIVDIPSVWKMIDQGEIKDSQTITSLCIGRRYFTF